MTKDGIFKCYELQKKEQMEIEKKSPYYIDGEWKSIVEGRLPSLQKILNYDHQAFYTIAHVAGPSEVVRHPHIAERISKYIKEESVICEIGSGIGGVCYNILSKYNPKGKIKYIIFDIPEILFIASCFLKLNLTKDLKVFHYDGNKSKFNFKNILEDHDLILLPHYLIEHMPKNILNCFINTGSFCEMPERTCKNYFYKILERSKDSSIFYFEFRKEENLMHYPSFSPLKSEIYVDPILRECSQNLGYDLKNILMETTGGQGNYWEAVYEN